MSANEKVGGRILFENEHIRVWDDVVPPGSTQEVHTHRKPYLAIAVAGEQAETVDASGAVIRTYEIEPGEVFWFGPEILPATHALRNTGATEISVVIVELL